MKSISESEFSPWHTAHWGKGSEGFRVMRRGVKLGLSLCSECGRYTHAEFMDKAFIFKNQSKLTIADLSANHPINTISIDTASTIKIKLHIKATKQ